MSINRRTSFPTTASFWKSRRGRLVAQGLESAPNAGRQMILPFDKLAHALNRNSQIGVILRALQGTRKRFGWIPPDSPGPGGRRRLAAYTDGDHPHNVSRPPGRPLLHLDTVADKSQPIDSYRISKRKISVGSTPNQIPDARDTLDVFFHELTHSQDDSKGKLTDFSVRKAETRAQLKAALVLQKILGTDEALHHSRMRHDAISRSPNSVDYGHGAKLVVDVLNRMKRKSLGLPLSTRIPPPTRPDPPTPESLFLG